MRDNRCDSDKIRLQGQKHVKKERKCLQFLHIVCIRNEIKNKSFRQNKLFSNIVIVDIKMKSLLDVVFVVQMMSHSRVTAHLWN